MTFVTHLKLLLYFWKPPKGLYHIRASDGMRWCDLVWLTSNCIRSCSSWKIAYFMKNHTIHEKFQKFHEVNGKLTLYLKNISYLHVDSTGFTFEKAWERCQNVNIVNTIEVQGVFVTCLGSGTRSKRGHHIDCTWPRSGSVTWTSPWPHV